MQCIIRAASCSTGFCTFFIVMSVLIADGQIVPPGQTADSQTMTPSREQKYTSSEKFLSERFKPQLWDPGLLNNVVLYEENK